jgi:hypothetical protein
MWRLNILQVQCWPLHRIVAPRLRARRSTFLKLLFMQASLAPSHAAPQPARRKKASKANAANADILDNAGQLDELNLFEQQDAGWSLTDHTNSSSKQHAYAHDHAAFMNLDLGMFDSQLEEADQARPSGPLCCHLVAEAAPDSNCG